MSGQLLLQARVVEGSSQQWRLDQAVPGPGGFGVERLLQVLEVGVRLVWPPRLCSGVGKKTHQGQVDKSEGSSGEPPVSGTDSRAVSTVAGLLKTSGSSLLLSSRLSAPVSGPREAGPSENTAWPCCPRFPSHSRSLSPPEVPPFLYRIENQPSSFAYLHKCASSMQTSK